jgi:hypothetical protein
MLITEMALKLAKELGPKLSQVEIKPEFERQN